jgi:hypothetical protein
MGFVDEERDTQKKGVTLSVQEGEQKKKRERERERDNDHKKIKKTRHY